MTPIVLSHLAILGRWCPGQHGPGHHADNLTARAGRILCGQCADAVLLDREREGAA